VCVCVFVCVWRPIEAPPGLESHASVLGRSAEYLAQQRVGEKQKRVGEKEKRAGQKQKRVGEKECGVPAVAASAAGDSTYFQAMLFPNPQPPTPKP